MLDLNLAHAGSTLLWFYCFEVVSLYLGWGCVEIWVRLSMEIDKLYIIDVGNCLKNPLKNLSHCDFCPVPARGSKRVKPEEVNGSSQR